MSTKRGFQNINITIFEKENSPFWEKIIMLYFGGQSLKAIFAKNIYSHDRLKAFSWTLTDVLLSETTKVWCGGNSRMFRECEA